MIHKRHYVNNPYEKLLELAEAERITVVNANLPHTKAASDEKLKLLAIDERKIENTT